ncbi:hypothetical protein B0H14DRAFT_3498355 [Mycena olivaceomarginata]|nr:hypothetical protein B0H14DRAFT_3498355 [Mycena olivaceomarginata]
MPDPARRNSSRSSSGTVMAQVTTPEDAGQRKISSPPLTAASTLMKNPTPPALPHPCGDQHALRAAAVHMGHSDKFFNYLVESSQGGKVLPTWKGEQYLDLESVPRCSSRLCNHVIARMW